MRTVIPPLLTLLWALLLTLPASADPRLEGIMPELKTLPRPTWVKPGARIIWWSGSNSTTVIQGQTKNQAGAGHNELTIVAVEEKSVAVSMRAYLSIGGSEHEAPTLAGSQGAVLPAGGGEYWCHPQALKALLGRQAVEGVQVGRIEKTVAGKKMILVTIGMDGATWQFDETSGALITLHTWTPQEVVNKTQTRTGSTMEFRAFEQVQYPWMSATLPAWTQKVKEYSYDAVMISGGIQGMEPIRQPFSVTHTRMGGGATWILTKLTTVFPSQQLTPPTPKPSVTGIGSLGVCLPPKELAKLQAGAVLGKNKFSQSTLGVVFVGEHQGKQVAILREEAPQFTIEWHYDLRSGVLVMNRIVNKAMSNEMQFVLKSAK